MALALPHGAVSCPEQAVYLFLSLKKQWYTRAQKKIFFVYEPVFSDERDTQRIDTPVVCSVAYSVTQATREGTHIHIHLWDPWAGVSVSTELHWALRCKSDSCFQTACVVPPETFRYLASWSLIHCLVLFLFTEYTDAKTEQTLDVCGKQHMAYKLSLYTFLTHSSNCVCLSILGLFFLLFCLSVSSNLCLVCLYKHLLNYICVSLHWELHSLIISGYILTPCPLRSKDMGVALKVGIFVAIQ